MDHKMAVWCLAASFIKLLPVYVCGRWTTLSHRVTRGAYLPLPSPRLSHRRLAPIAVGEIAEDIRLTLHSRPSGITTLYKTLWA